MINQGVQDHLKLSQVCARQKAAELKKFIQTMNSLTWHIRQNLSHQISIFQCLNSEQQRRLFQSIKDQDEQLRITAIVFISHLLYRNERLVKLMMSRQGIQAKEGMTKYIIGGLSRHKIDKIQLIKILKIISTLQFKENAICWSINLSTLKVSYLMFQKFQDQSPSNYLLYNKQTIDPMANIIGIFAVQQFPTYSSLSSNNSQSSFKGGYSQRYRMSKR